MKIVAPPLSICFLRLWAVCRNELWVMWLWGGGLVVRSLGVVLWVRFLVGLGILIVEWWCVVGGAESWGCVVG